MTKKPSAASRAGGFVRWLTHTVGGGVTTLGAIAALVGLLWAIDDRYAHAGEVSQKFSRMETGQEINRLTIETSTMDVKLQLLRAQLSQLSYAQGPMTRDRAAERERLNAEITSVSQDLSTKKQLLDRLRTGTK